MAIPEDSLLYRTGQLWKLRFLLGVYVALLIMIGAPLETDSAWFAPVMALSAIVAAASLAVPWWSIRCPRCRAAWFWLAISQKHNVGWYKWLSTLPSCPVCTYPHSDLRPK